MKNNSLKNKLFISLATVLCGLGSTVYAHTTIQNQISNSSTTYNNVVIGHGCTDENGRKIPVRMQSVVFPTINPVLTEGSDNVTVSPLTLANIITSATGLANIPQLIQSNDVFKTQSEKTDASGRVIGFNGILGNLNPTLHGLIPFRTGGISFVENATASNGQCIQKLAVKIGIADICMYNFPPQEGMANLWLPNTTTKFPLPMDGNGDGTAPRNGAPATLTINNPACPSGQTVTVWPSDEDIDANLIIPGVWGN